MALTALHRFGPEDLNPDEEIIYRARLNFVAFLVSIKLWLFLIFVAIAIISLSYLFRAEIGFLIDSTITLGITLFALLFLIPGLYEFFYLFVDWLYDEDIITNQRVVDYNQKFLFSKDLTTANMKSIENVILEQGGVLQTFFNFGNLSVQTSAAGAYARPGDFGKYLVLQNISRPKQVQRLIDEIAHRVKKEVVVDKDEVLRVCGLG